MKMIRSFGLALFFVGGVFVGCSSGGGMGAGGMSAPDPKLEACKAACDKAKDEAVEKCAEEVDQDACKIAADAAREECVQKCNEDK